MSNGLEDRLRAELNAQSHTAPPEPALDDVLDQCERDLSRRRLAVVVAGALAAGVAAVVVLPFLVEGPDGSEIVNDTGRLSDETLIEVCRSGSQPAFLNELMFGSGTPQVATRSDAGAVYSTTILVSADGRYWADCFNAENAYANTPGALSDEPGRSSMEVYENIESENLPSYNGGGMCPAAKLEDCDTFFIDYANRLPETVGAVEFTTVDGRTTRVDTTSDGFVVFDYQGDVPAEARSRTRAYGLMTKMVYLDADGTPVAANRLQAKYLDQKIDGLAPLTDYPSLARTPEPDE